MCRTLTFNLAQKIATSVSTPRPNRSGNYPIWKPLSFFYFPSIYEIIIWYFNIVVNHSCRRCCAYCCFSNNLYCISIFFFYNGAWQGHRYRISFVGVINLIVRFSCLSAAVWHDDGPPPDLNTLQHHLDSQQPPYSGAFCRGKNIKNKCERKKYFVRPTHLS